MGEVDGLNLDFTSGQFAFELTAARLPGPHCVVLASIPMRCCRRLYREQDLERIDSVLARIASAFSARAAVGAIEYDGDYGQALSPDRLEALFRASMTDAAVLREAGLDLVAGRQELVGHRGHLPGPSGELSLRRTSCGWWFLQERATLDIFAL
ncbi:hypothetical protein [Marilutibacter alkalisoli]|uniref:Uncharacterized protein n=1 Tax=Marilutibacter alkalisoli TaxID=2591633 RepID=A0A514BMW1_9GAMM|nr:hypothetical protein [Lysobacter alkalisoli]QDH68712.1 hypothetical protein FKV23_00215 [Lysobacter alkalisoli]